MGTAITLPSLLILVLISPLALQQLGEVEGVDWTELSFIGQTYGAISAAISAIALGGVALSLILHARADALNREQAERTFHLELCKMAIDDPTLLQCWGPPPTAQTFDDRRLNSYTNLIINFWLMMHRIGIRNEAELTENLSAMFKGEIGRTYWMRTRRGWIDKRKNRHEREFLRIAETAYQATTPDPPTPKSNNDSTKEPGQELGASGRSIQAKIIALLLAIFFGGALIDRLLNRRRGR